MMESTGRRADGNDAAHPSEQNNGRERILFVTGRLAEPLVRSAAEELSRTVGFEYDVEVLGITVAALMHVDWVARKLTLSRDYDRVLLPGWCHGDVEQLTSTFGVRFCRGPKDVCDLSEMFGRGGRSRPPMDEFQIEILAEINHAPSMSDHELLDLANRYRAAGADVIDLGCVPGESWSRAGAVTRLLRQEEFRISIDSFDRAEVEAAVNNGAELILSCDQRNIDWASRLGAELVVIPDDPHDLSTLERSLDRLADAQARFRIDPILEPIGFGFAASLERYYAVRRQWPDAEMLMGIGNLTELTEVDTAGMNVLLAALCQELRIHSVLTTQVISWAQSAVSEFDRARRLVWHSLTSQSLPKHVESGLVMLRDTRIREMGPEAISELASRLTDPNFRIFVEAGEIHMMNRDGYWRGNDAFEVFDQAVAAAPVDPSHAFYLGYELAKAVTALTLGKQYTQDQALRWGLLTVEETSTHQRRSARKRGVP